MTSAAISSRKRRQPEASAESIVPGRRPARCWRRAPRGTRARAPARWRSCGWRRAAGQSPSERRESRRDPPGTCRHDPAGADAVAGLTSFIGDPGVSAGGAKISSRCVAKYCTARRTPPTTARLLTVAPAMASKSPPSLRTHPACFRWVRRASGRKGRPATASPASAMAAPIPGVSVWACDPHAQHAPARLISPRGAESGRT